MSTITSLSVSSSPAIRFRWEGTGGETLTRHDGSSLIQPGDLAGSAVGGLGASSVPAGGPVNLTGWIVSQCNPIAHETPTFEVVLSPPSPPVPPNLQFQTGRVVSIAFTLRTRNGAARPFPAAAIVDAPYGEVINALTTVAAPGPGIKQDMDYLAGFPFQVYDSYNTPSGGGGAAGVPSAQAMIDAQMKAVLGRATGSGGVAGTLAALDRSFQMVVADGVDAYVWQPQSYAAQSDIGAGVTGEQASLATLAVTVGQEILPLVAGLTPLVPEATVNPDEIAAFKAIFASSWPGFVNEVGIDAGPRINRASSLLQDVGTSLVNLGIILGMYQSGTFLGQPATATTRAQPSFGIPGGTFDALTDSTWPAPDRSNGVVTGDDEDNYTNFVIASDRVKMVIARFTALYLATPPKGVPSNEDRGFLVTLLQRSLDATGEAADAVYGALDSVNLGQDEREVIFVPGTDPSNTPGYAGTGALSVEDILSWAAAFPAQEATPLLQDAGNVGIGALSARAAEVASMVGLMRAWAGGTPASPPSPPGLAHPRVTYALTILSLALTDVTNYASNAQLAYPNPKAP
jgi:hypothetical protein